MLRKPNISSAAVDLVSAAVALGLGVANAPPFAAGLVFGAAALVWAWTRRGVLARMNWRQRATNGALALGMLTVVLGTLYWIGLTFGGHS